MNTMILRVKKCGQMTTVQSEKSENGVLDKRTLVLQELGGKYENCYVVTERIFDFNPYGVRVRRCCASCSHRDISRAVSSRYCTEHHKDVNPHQMCSLWKMSDLLRTLKPGE